MPKLEKFTPILRVKDLSAGIAFYKRVGFAVDFEYKFAENERAHYAGVSRDGQTLHLSTFRENGQVNTQVFVTVDDIDALHRELVQSGVNCLPPGDMEWGQREMSVRDPDGNVLRFAMRI